MSWEDSATETLILARSAGSIRRRTPVSTSVKLGKTPRCTCRSLSRCAAWTVATMRSMSMSTISACLASTRAALVGSTLWAERSNSFTPIFRSSAAICWETADEVYPSRLAAAAKEPS